MIGVLIICGVVLITHLRFRRDLDRGLAAAVFFLVLLPVEVRLETPGALPELTAHRALLLLSAWHVLTRRGRGESENAGRLPLLTLLLLVGVARFFSTMHATALVPSIKDLLSFVLEILLFYWVMGSGLRSRAAVAGVVRAAVYAAGIVAGIATLEKYAGVNYALRLAPDLPDWPNSITATFRHRILFGYCMAMAFPLALALLLLAEPGRQRRLAWFVVALLPAACYFGNSRGPWAGLALAGLVMAVAAGPLIRKRLVFLGVLGALLLATRPGVWETIHSRWEATKTTDTQKGRSASYRLELWRVAFRQLTKSADRFVVGFGGGSLETMDLGSEFELGGSAGALGYTSWDSEYAADFMKFGALGLSLEALLYGSLLLLCWRSWRGADPPDRPLLAAGTATVLVFLWAMTNVAIFNPQLTYLFWTVVAVMARAAIWARAEADPPGAPMLATEELYPEIEVVETGVSLPRPWS
ncbi:MAG TPA: O-antigen ligase family protein [Methylomirabilota bacterium]|nr:O-antigen ligase family protein [Methylomirabilota bacterium]